MQIKTYSPPKRRILYYPTITIPSDSWLRQALLYWDEVSSIVPKDYDDNLLYELTPDLNYLLAEGEYKPIFPDELIEHWNEFQAFASEFLEIVKHPNYPLVNSKTWSKIHSNKTSSEIFNTLREKGLARETSEYKWLEFEHNTALLYMSKLAKHLANVQTISTAIGTNFKVYESLNFKKTKIEGSPIISVNLDNLLPVPRENVAFEQILDFKRKRRGHLLQYRKMLLEYYSKLQSATSKNDFRDITTDFKSEMEAGLFQLKSVLKDAKIAHYPKTISVLTAAGADIAKELIEPQNNLSISIAIGAGAVAITCFLIENKFANSAKMAESPFSYLYQAQKAGIINPFNS